MMSEGRDSRAGVDGAWTLDGNAEAIASAFADIRSAWRKAGREEAPHLSSSIWCALGPAAEERLRRYAYDHMKIFGADVGKWAAGSVACHTAAALSSAIDSARDAGADEFFLVPTTADPKSSTGSARHSASERNHQPQAQSAGPVASRTVAV